MIISFPKETKPNENRIAITPDTVKKYTDLGMTVNVQKDAGLKANFTNEQYQQQGANITEDTEQLYQTANIIAKINPPDENECHKLQPQQTLITNMNSYNNKELIHTLAGKNISVVALELMPRITRAQNMDILSSQNNIAGYKAVITAAEKLNRSFPMMMTAAGTIPPVKTMIMGVGVAGLQAIATAKRLGAVVSATDVRPATKTQVESLGGQFIAVENDEFLQAQTDAGYAKEMSDDYKAQQAELIKKTIAKQDIVITTALIPGKPAPKLITQEMLDMMQPGSVIVDMATAAGGNCYGSQVGQTITHKHITIIAGDNLAADIPQTTSALMAKNILNFVTLFTDTENKKFHLDEEDEIIRCVLATHNGAIFSESLKTMWSA